MTSKPSTKAARAVLFLFAFTLLNTQNSFAARDFVFLGYFSAPNDTLYVNPSPSFPTTTQPTLVSQTALAARDWSQLTSPYGTRLVANIPMPYGYNNISIEYKMGDLGGSYNSEGKFVDGYYGKGISTKARNVDYRGNRPYADIFCSRSYIVFGTLTFNSRVVWDESSAYHIAAHELGHCLGLGHPGDEPALRSVPAIMASNEKSNPGTTVSTFQNYDRAAISALYGTHPLQAYHWNLFENAKHWPTDTKKQRMKRHHRVLNIKDALDNLARSTFANRVS